MIQLLYIKVKDVSSIRAVQTHVRTISRKATVENRADKTQEDQIKAKCMFVYVCACTCVCVFGVWGMGPVSVSYEAGVSWVGSVETF